MGLVAAKCTNCGAAIEVDDTKEAGNCRFCGTAFITEKVINNYNTYITHNITQHITAQNVTFKTGKSVDEHIADGDKYLKLGNFANAAASFWKAVDEDPDSGIAWKRYAQSTVPTNFEELNVFSKNLCQAWKNAYRLYENKAEVVTEWTRDAVNKLNMSRYAHHKVNTWVENMAAQYGLQGASAQDYLNFAVYTCLEFVVTEVYDTTQNIGAQKAGVSAIFQNEAFLHMLFVTPNPAGEKKFFSKLYEIANGEQREILDEAAAGRPIAQAFAIAAQKRQDKKEEQERMERYNSGLNVLIKGIENGTPAVEVIHNEILNKRHMYFSGLFPYITKKEAKQCIDFAKTNKCKDAIFYIKLNMWQCKK